MLTIHAKNLFRPGDALHFTRTVLSRAPIRQIHNHDYFELFWLQHGRALHVVNDVRQNLSEGDLVFVRPTDCHGIQGKGEETHVVNIAFPCALIDAIAQRHELTGRFFWHDAPLPHQVHRNIRELAMLSGRAVQIENAPKTALAAEAFLLTLLQELQGPARDVPDDLPDWLATALIRAHERDVFRQGAAGLVRLSGRGHAHVSRSCQRYLGMTPSDYVNSIRIAQAARDLIGSSDSVADIANDCGIANLSHFHRLFRQAHGVTPSQFRKTYQKNVVQPI